MPFPFLPGGLLLALTVLGGAFAVFAAALHLLDRAASTAQGSIAAGLEAGLRTWGHDPPRERSRSSPPSGEPALGPFRLMGVRPYGAVSRLDEGDPGGIDAAPASLPGAVVEEIEAGGVATERVRRRATVAPRDPGRAARREP